MDSQNYDLTMPNLVQLAEKGITVYLTYGPCSGPAPAYFSVDCLFPDGTGFESPVGARTLLQCTEIALTESAQRGWLGT